MNPNELNEAIIGKRRPIRKVENIAVRISDIELSDDKPAYFVGNRIDTNEPIRVRMMTVDEAVEANLRKNSNEGDRTRLKNYFEEKFISGSFVRPSPEKFADPSAKEHVATGGVVMFDRALLNDDGTYRAQWASTIAPRPENEAMKVFIHLDAREENPELKRKALVSATILAPEKAVELKGDDRINVIYALMSSKDTNGHPRNPNPVIRMTMNDGTFQHASIPAMSKTETRKNFNTGAQIKINTPLPPEEAIEAILQNERMAETRNGRLVKAVLSGLSGKPANWGKMTDEQKKVVERLADSIANGQTPVTAIPGQRIYAGNNAAVDMIKKGSRPNSPMSRMLNSVRTKEITVKDEVRVITEPTYTEAVIGLMRHKDTKAPFLRDVSLTSPFPKFMTLNEVPLGMPKPEAVAQAELDDTPLDMDIDEAEVDAALASAADFDEASPSF